MAAVLLGLLAFWLLTLPLWTLLFYWAVMHVKKGQVEGWASPEAVWVGEKVFLPIGAVNNLALAQTWGRGYYRTWASGVGLTALTNRMADHGTPEQAAKAAYIRDTYLNWFDPKGEHT